MAYGGSAYGSSPYAGQSAGAGGLSGASTGLSSASGTLTVAVALTGTNLSTSSANGTLPVPVALTGSSASSSSATGTLPVPVALTGSSASSSSATGTLTMLLTGQSGGASRAWAAESTVQVISATGAVAIGGAAALARIMHLTAAASVEVDGGAVLAPVIPAPTVPSGLSVPGIWQVSPAMPAPTLADGVPQGWAPSSVTVANWGYLQLVVDNTDVTFFRGVPAAPYTYTFSMPGSDEAAELRVYGITPFDVLGSGTLAWCKVGVNADIRRVAPDNTISVLWEGMVASIDVVDDSASGQPYVALQCQGVLRQANMAVQNPRLYQATVDTGVRAAAALNDVVGRRYAAIDPPATGEPITVRGSRTQTRLQFEQQMLASSTTANGDGWTLTNSPGRIPKIRLISSLTTVWTVSAGAPGVSLNLTSDATVAPNVIYGDGTDPTGAWWGASRWPRPLPDDGLAWCGTTISQGTTDSQTASGSGVTDAQHRLMVGGFGSLVTGQFNATDVAGLKRFQAFAGLTANGTLDQATWTALFAAGSSGGSIAAAYFAPLAWNPKVEPYTYHLDGSISGTNPAYDPTVLRVEKYENYGEGIYLAEAIASAQAELTRVPSPGWSGTVVLLSDPAEGSRFEIRDGHQVQVEHFQGGTITARVSQVQHDTQQMQTTLTIDTYNRDALTVAAVILRNREALQDPASTLLQRRSSRVTLDQLIQFDSEGGAGIIPFMSVAAGQWTVVQVPSGTTGSVVAMALAAGSGLVKGLVGVNPNAPFWVGGGGVATAISGPTKFAVAVFDQPIANSTVAGLVGDPFASSDPFGPNATQLGNAGLLAAYGSSSESPGYFPGQESKSAAVTGYFYDHGGFQYTSAADAWLWVAVYAPVACKIEGRLWAAVPSF